MIKEKVIVIGGGVGGLTAAHELVERDFDVEVYERRHDLGGKAASQRDASNLPTEHGFRFFPSWYRHVPDTMSRIPCRGVRGVRDPATVADRLIPVHHGLLAFYGREPLPWVTHVPRTVRQAHTQASFFGGLSAAGLGPGEVALLGRKLAEFFAAPDSVRLALWEKVTWWEYLEAEGKSAAYQDLVAASTRLIIAAQAKETSAYSIGRLVMRTFSDAWTTVDRILDGPTNEAWIEPWVDHLRGCGARFELGWELQSIVFCSEDDAKASHGGSAPGPSGGSLNAISHVIMSRVVVTLVERLRGIVGILRAYLGDTTNGERARLALERCQELASAVLRDRDWKREVARARERIRARGGRAPAAPEDADLLVDGDAVVTAIRDRAHEAGASVDAFVDAVSEVSAFHAVARRIDPHWVAPGAAIAATASRRPIRPDTRERSWVLQMVAATLEYVSATEFARPRAVHGQYFVFALPVEQLAYYANRSAAMTFHDPSLKNLVKLATFVSWMSGIQFYLREPCQLVEGHLLCVDSEWSLTAIEQTQFWGDTDLTLGGKLADDPELGDQKIKSVISVDISTWDRPGRFVPREAFNCRTDEIAREVWGQLKASVTRLSKSARLRDDMLLGGPTLREGVNFNLDKTLADVHDPKKQAEYERARGLDIDIVAEAGVELPFIWGASREYNTEPLLLNGPGSRALRPQERTAIENLFIAADYVRTDTDLACMEGANEAGRRAANAVLHASGSLHPPSQVFSLSMTRDALAAAARLVGDGKGAWELAAQSVRTAGQLVDNLLGVTGLTRARSSRERT